tara:strand:- start:1944 stop:2090 length:147 start_codon:yes stop_codon:yes gene_type:complete
MTHIYGCLGKIEILGKIKLMIGGIMKSRGLIQNHGKMIILGQNKKFIL